MKIYTTIFLLGLSCTSFAQLKKGDWSIGTSTNAPFSLSLQKNDARNKSYNFSFNPQFGYMLSNRFEIGGGPVLGFSGTTIKDPDGTTLFKTRSNSIGADIFTRYYFKQSGKLIPYLTAGVQYLHTRGSTTDFNSNKTSFNLNQWQVYGGVGLNWFVSPRASIFSELKYTGNWGNGNGYMHGLNLQVGFRFFFGKK